MKKSNDIAIRLSGVTKRYTIHHEKPTLVEKLVHGRDEEFWALKDINLTIKKGERAGIIGPNLTRLWVNHPSFINLNFK